MPWKVKWKAMFMGEYLHSIDAKGRMRMPAKFRDDLGEKFVVTKGTGKCLFVFTTEEWQIFSQKLRTLPLTDRNVQAFVRMLYAGASELELDAQCRILLPQNLREYAELEKDVYVIGVANRVEIWSAKNWSEYNEASADNFDEVLGRMAELGI